MKTKKISNNNNEQNKENKKQTDGNKDIKPEIVYLGEYFSVHTKQYHPTTKKFIEREIDRLIEWANQEESLIIQDFWLSGGYSKAQFYTWIERFPEFAYAHEYAMTRIGSRRELGAMTRKFDANTIHRTLGAYNHIWREQTLELAKLKNETTQPTTVELVVKPFEDFQVSTKTPEEVAMKIHNSTRDSRLPRYTTPEGVEE